MLLNENDITVDAESADGNNKIIESCQLDRYSASGGYFDQIVSLKLRKSGEVSVRLSFSLNFLKKAIAAIEDENIPRGSGRKPKR